MMSLELFSSVTKLTW